MALVERGGAAGRGLRTTLFVALLPRTREELGTGEGRRDRGRGGDRGRRDRGRGGDRGREGGREGDRGREGGREGM